MESKAKILVVEDEIIVARDVQKRLETLGYDVVGSAASAEEAISLATTTRPDLVMMDIILKGDKDGIYAAEIIKSKCKAPIIFLTANSDKSTVERAKHTDAYGYLLKPFDDRELMTTIEMALYKFRLNSELESNRHWFLTMFNSIGEAVVSLDANNCVNFLNPMARRLLAIAEEDILGQPVNTYLNLVDDGRTYDLVAMVDNLRKDKSSEPISEFILETHKGEQIPIDFNARCIIDEQGKEFGVVLAFRDVSERKSAEEEIREANRKLEMQKEGLQKANDRMHALYKKLEEQNAELQKLDHLKSEFISTVSHELRTPLTIIREGVSLVNDGVLGEVNDSQIDMFKDIIESTDRLTKIINDLLDVSKLESGKLDLYRKETDTKSLLTKLVKEFTLKANKNEIELRAEVDDDVFSIYADGDRLVQVFSNLIGNALKFTPAQGSVTVKAENKGDLIEISVVDTGKGIALDDQLKLFDKFSQFGRTAGPGEKGTGLGLSIAKSLVEMHEGEIEVKSELGQGSSFICRIPRYLGPEDRALRAFDKYRMNQLESEQVDSMPAGLVLVQIANYTELELQESLEHLESFTLKVEKILSSSLYKEHDMIFSLSKGEFILFLPETNYLGACAVGNKLRDKLKSESLYSNLLHLEPQFSFGFLESDLVQTEVQNLIKQTRSAMTRKKKILIVDDHPQVVRLLSYRLSKEDRYDCHGVFNGLEAMDYLEEEIPDLIILDIMMPEMSGYEVVGRLKEDRRFRDIPLVLLTAMAVDSPETSSPLPGSIPVVSKTEGFRNLMQIIDSL